MLYSVRVLEAVCQRVQRLTRKVLLCANNVSVPRIQPYKYSPRAGIPLEGVPRQYPLRGSLSGALEILATSN